MDEQEQKLYDKWKHRIGDGWYGFDISGVPHEWITQIDEHLIWLEKNFPDFKIQQIKTKYGRIRCHVDLGFESDSLINEEVLKEAYSREDKLETLYSKDLIY